MSSTALQTGLRQIPCCRGGSRVRHFGCLVATMAAVRRRQGGTLQGGSFPGVSEGPGHCLPSMDLAAARHIFQTCEGAVALARLGPKLGIRVRECDEAKTWEKLRPQHEFVKVQVTAKFRIFPLPFGFQRKGVIQLLRRWNWCARALQPARGDSTGIAWEIGASSDPPAPTMPLGDGFVVLSKIRDLQQQPAAPLVGPKLASTSFLMMMRPFLLQQLAALTRGCMAKTRGRKRVCRLRPHHRKVRHPQSLSKSPLSCVRTCIKLPRSMPDPLPLTSQLRIVSKSWKSVSAR